MCYTYPGNRCYQHSSERYHRLLKKTITTPKESKDFHRAQHDFDLVVVKEAGVAKANIQYYLSHPDAFDSINEKDAKKYDEHVDILNRYAEIKQQYTPAEIADLRDEATDRVNIGHYLASEKGKAGQPTNLNIPDNGSNAEAVRMFHLLATEGSRPLTPAEEEFVAEAQEKLDAGIDVTIASERATIEQRGGMGVTKVSAAPTVPSVLQRKLTDPDEQEVLRSERERARAALLAQAGEQGTTPATLQALQNAKTPVTFDNPNSKHYGFPIDSKAGLIDAEGREISDTSRKQAALYSHDVHELSVAT